MSEQRGGELIRRIKELRSERSMSLVEAANIARGELGMAPLDRPAPADVADLLAEARRLREAIDRSIGVVTVTPIPDQSPIVNGATSMWGYSTPYATVQDAAQRAMSTATLCLLVPVDADGNLL